jgi:hypothetical protein
VMGGSKIESEIFMQCIPAPSRVIRRIEPRLEEKRKENFLGNFREKIIGPECRAAGRTRHAEPLNWRGAEFDFSQILALSVSHARPVPPVRSSKS